MTAAWLKLCHLFKWSNGTYRLCFTCLKHNHQGKYCTLFSLDSSLGVWRIMTNRRFLLIVSRRLDAKNCGCNTQVTTLFDRTYNCQSSGRYALHCLTPGLKQRSSNDSTRFRMLCVLVVRGSRTTNAKKKTAAATRQWEYHRTPINKIRTIEKGATGSENRTVRMVILMKKISKEMTMKKKTWWRIWQSSWKPRILLSLHVTEIHCSDGKNFHQKGSWIFRRITRFITLHSAFFLIMTQKLTNWIIAKIMWSAISTIVAVRPARSIAIPSEQGNWSKQHLVSNSFVRWMDVVCTYRHSAYLSCEFSSELNGDLQYPFHSFSLPFDHEIHLGDDRKTRSHLVRSRELSGDTGNVPWFCRPTFLKSWDRKARHYFLWKDHSSMKSFINISFWKCVNFLISAELLPSNSTGIEPARTSEIASRKVQSWCENHYVRYEMMSDKRW